MKARRYTAGYIDTVKLGSSINELLAERDFTKLNQSVHMTSWACPFEREGELLVRDQKGYYLCRTCDQAGDIFSLVQKLDHVTFTEAIALIGERFKPGSSQLRNNLDLEKRMNNTFTTNEPHCQSDPLAEECPDQDCEHLDESNAVPMYAAEGRQTSVGILNEVGEVIGHFDGPVEVRAFALRLLDLGSNLLKAENDRPRLNDADVVQLKDFRGEQS